jgi:hypothetical protein
MRTASKEGMCIVTLFLGLACGPLHSADAPKFPTILYGASYYLEYMPYERLEADVDLMEKAGITFARVGESTWGVMEPQGNQSPAQGRDKGHPGNADLFHPCLALQKASGDPGQKNQSAALHLRAAPDDRPDPSDL